MQSKKSIYDAEMPLIVAGVSGDTSIEYSDATETFILRHKGIQWMGSDKYFICSKDLLHSQYEVAYGDVLITGLGFGILTKALAKKPGVSSVTVLELNQDVIDMYLASNELEDNVTIIQADASTYQSDKKYDCLLPDHYELQGIDWVISDMRDLAKRIKHDVYWPWSIEEIFLIKTYPREHFNLKFSDLLEQKKDEIPQKWRDFIANNLDSHQTLMSIDDETLFEYLQKHAIYYYDRRLDKTDWGI